MGGRTISLVAVFSFIAIIGPAHPAVFSEPLPVVVTIPVLKDFVEQVGGTHVRVTSLLSGQENEHTYSPKPSDLVAVRKARLFVEVGMGLEVWVGPLVRNAGNAGLRVVTTSDGVPRLAGLDPHGHADGNPHIWLDPNNVKLMVGRIAEALAAADPAHAGEYSANESRYRRDIETLETELLGVLRGLPDRRLVVHHPAWPYFARRFGFDIVGEIVTQPGAEPSARHLQNLANKIRADRLRVIISEPQLNQKLPRILAQESGARLVVLTAMPGGLPGTGTYLDMLRYNVVQLAQALRIS